MFFTLLLVTGNTMAISVRERIGELAVLKAIGFSDRSVLFFVLAESLTIAMVGGLLGLGSCAPGIPGSGRGSEWPAAYAHSCRLRFFRSASASALLVGVVSGLLPGIGAMRLRVVDALRRV